MRRTLSAAALAALALAACGDSTAPQLTDDSPLLTADVALVAAEAAGHDVEMMFGPSGDVGMGFPLGPQAAPGRGFACQGGSRMGVTLTVTCTFRDAAGNTQTAFDSLTTASVNVKSTLSGSIARESWSATVNRTRDMTVSGLAGVETQRTFNGTGSDSETRSRVSEGGATRSYDMTGSVQVRSVVVPVGGTNRWPLSGSITRQTTVKFTGGDRDGQTATRSSTITFNGTQFATLTVGDKTFEVDLAKRKAGPARGRP